MNIPKVAYGLILGCLTSVLPLQLQGQQKVSFSFDLEGIEIGGKTTLTLTSGKESFTLGTSGGKILLTQKGKGEEVGLKMVLAEELPELPQETFIKTMSALENTDIQKGNAPFDQVSSFVFNGAYLLDQPRGTLSMNWTGTKSIVNTGSVAFVVKKGGEPVSRFSIPIEVVLLDSDGDEVPDVADKCPDEKGVPKEEGCKPKKTPKQERPRKKPTASPKVKAEAGEQKPIADGGEPNLNRPSEEDSSTELTENQEGTFQEGVFTPEGSQSEESNASQDFSEESDTSSTLDSTVKFSLFKDLTDILLSIALVVVLTLLGILIFRSRKQKTYAEKVEIANTSKIREDKSDFVYKMGSNSSADSPKEEEVESNEEEIEESTSEPEEAPQSEEEISLLGEIDFTEKEKESVPFPYDDPELRTHYLPIALWQCWEDTTVKEIYLHKRSIRQLDQHIRGENLYKIDPETGDEIPEIGGFLMGFLKEIEGQYELCIERFIPITPESHNRFTVKFGDRAWIEWSDAQSKYPDELLLGWFHTHPGHGLFLSEADIKVQKDQFTLDYLVAMEIDTLTPDFDTAFFTWKKGAKHLNNAEDRKLDSWYSFMDMDRATRLKS